MLLDIAAGIIFAVLTGQWFDVPLTAAWVWLGIGLALLPDLDALAEMVRKRGWLGGKTDGVHRTWLHYPMLYIPALLVVWALWGAPVAVLGALAIFFHLTHDSTGTGWGVRWLGPFKKTNYKFFAEKDNRVSSRLLVSWEPEELKEAQQRYGNERWFRDIYLRLTWTSAIELVGFFVALVILFHAFRSQPQPIEYVPTTASTLLWQGSSM